MTISFVLCARTSLQRTSTFGLVDVFVNDMFSYRHNYFASNFNVGELHCSVSLYKNIVWVTTYFVKTHHIS